ncbi:unnamed protein product [Hymenolepis diminuta]|uniref:Uncharacterized protein n=1 Tax=Hymenolepis diminuta TaxID=6216 RepID=A0A564YK18_HYMDI|nr:unnamed protein product [Hymenolepis diminuta]
MKRHAVIVSIITKHGNLEIARFLEAATSLVCKVRKEPLNEGNGGELAATSRRKQHCQRSADLLTTRELVIRVHDMMDENPGKLMRDILPNIIKCLKEA